MIKRYVMLMPVLVLVLFLPISALTHAQDSAKKDPITFIKTYLDYITDQGSFGGTVLIAQGDNILLNEGYGMANIEWNVPNIPDGKFRIASITKQFTAIAVLMLQERGKLRIEDHICSYLKDCPEAWSDITIDELLTHTDGLPPFAPSIELLMSQPVEPSQLISTFIKQPLIFKPGTRWEYGNSGYIILGQIITMASGQPYQDFLKDYIFDPLGMKNTGFDNSKAIINQHVTGYANRLVVADLFNPDIFYSAGALYSTTGDLLIWTRALFQGKVVSSETVSALLGKLKGFTEPQGPRYGFELDTVDGHKYVYKGGSFPGFWAALYYFPDDEITVVILSNFETARMTDIGTTIFRLLFGTT